MLDHRRVFLVPPCDAEEDGELSVVGVRQARALGDALGDVALRAAYAGPGLDTEETASAVAQRHGLAVRRKPGLEIVGAQEPDQGWERIVGLFEQIARVGPGRTTLIVAAPQVLGIALAHCRGLKPPAEIIDLEAGSLTEIRVEERRYVVERVGDTSHIGPTMRTSQ